METRSRAKEKEHKDLYKESQDELPEDKDERLFEEHVTNALGEIQNYIANAEAEKMELKQQMDNLFVIIESQKMQISRMNLANDEKFRECEARLCALEFNKGSDCDQETQTMLLKLIDDKLNEAKDTVERAECVEEKLNLKFIELLNKDPESISTKELVSTPTCIDTTNKGNGRKLASKPIQMPPTYDGATPWEAYSAQFEIVSQINGWTEMEKALFLATSLKGNATLILSNLSEENRADFNMLVKALSNRFGATHQSELARAKFKTRVKQREESLPELAADLERLVKLAYPRAESDLQDTLAKDQFIDGLQNEESRIRVRQGRPKSIQGALEIALELESYHLADRWEHLHSRSTAHARQVNLQDQSTKVKEKPLELERNVETEISKLGTLIGQVLEEVKQRGQIRRSDRQRMSRCYRCLELGHIQSACPLLLQQNQQPTNNQQPRYGVFGYTGLPLQRQDTTGFPSQRQDATGYPQRQDSTGFPSQRQDTTGFPSQRQDTTGFPSQRQDATGYPQQRRNATEFSQQHQDSTRTVQQRQQGTSASGNFQRSSSRGRGRPW